MCIKYSLYGHSNVIEYEKYVYKIFFVTHFTAMTLMCCHKKKYGS